jgi:vacuolar protein sorting-associated protein 35
VKALTDVLQLLPYTPTRKMVALEWIQMLLQRKQRVTSVEEMEFLVEVLAPVIRDDPNGTPLSLETSSASRKEVEAFEREQLNLSKVIHLVGSDDLDAQFRMLSVARRAFGQGGVFRIRFTLVPLIYRSLALAREVAIASSVESSAASPAVAGTVSAREVLQFVHEMVTALASKLEQMSVTCVSLFLQCALVADSGDLEAIAYEFITQAFIVYEDQITNSREQWKALELMVASLRATTHMSAANYEVLAAKTTQYAARLLKKNEQASMVVNCAHLFWVRGFLCTL